jgi:hypothetical protein
MLTQAHRAVEPGKPLIRGEREPGDDEPSASAVLAEADGAGKAGG